MAETTQNLALPFIAGNQAQKHVTHNEALILLDALVQLACLDKDLSAPPAAPNEGDRYLVTAPAPSGAWTGLSGQVVRFSDGVWTGSVPKPGWLAYVVDEADLYVFAGLAWTSFRSSLTVLQNLSRVGIGTQADATNRFAVKSDAALFAWDDVTPGTGHIRVALNKQAAGRDAGFAFQTGFSTRALFGTWGSDDLSLKVSSDGTTFQVPLTVSAASGRLKFGRIDGPVEVSSHAGGLPAAPDQTVLRVSGADATQPRLVFDSFGQNVPGNFIFRAAAGTASSPSALTGGMAIGQFSAFGFGASAYSSGARAQIAFLAAEPWSDSAQGTRIAFRACPTGSTGIIEVAACEANGAVSLKPLAADPTVGTGLGQLCVNGTHSALKWHDGTAWRRLGNLAKCLARPSTDTSLAAGAWTKVAFNLADSNEQGAFSAAGQRFTAPEAGLYRLTLALGYRRNGSNAPTAFEGRFFRNGAATIPARAAATGPLVDGVTALGLSAIAQLAPGDTVEVYARFTGADGSIASADTHFSVAQMP